MGYYSQVSETITLSRMNMTTYEISSEEIIENASETYRTRWEVGDMVVVHALNDLVGEVTKRSLNGDGDYDYMVHYDRDGSIEWCEWSDLREANDLDNWSLTERECFSLSVSYTHLTLPTTPYV